MIEINLYPGKGTGSAEGSGVDFNHISIPGMLIALIIWGLYTFVAPQFYDKRLKSWEGKLTETRTALGKNKRKMRKVKELKREIELAKKEEQVLFKQLGVIKELTVKQGSPMKVLLYLSRNIPENTWITNFYIKGKTFFVEGKSFSYSLIGRFYDSLSGSIFFQAPPKLKTETLKLDKTQSTRRLESFNIMGTLRHFE